MTLYTKQTIAIGAAVDDFTGDYLRLGGQKINDNMDDIYSSLGDETSLHPAGAWRVWTFNDGATLNADIGQQYIVDTTDGIVSVVLPAVTPSDYGKVIKIADVYGTLSTNKITISPTGSTINNGGAVDFITNYSKIELTYTSNDDWKYIDGMTLNSLPSSNVAATVKYGSFIIAGTNDLSGTFTIPGGYNISAMEVYLNGVLQYYDSGTPGDGGYGSGVPSALVVLDGNVIALKSGIYKADDIFTYKTYLAAIGAASEGFNRYTVEVSNATDDPGQLAIPTNTDLTLSLPQFGAAAVDRINVNAAQVFIDGNLLTPAGIGNFVDPDEYKFEESVPTEGYDLVTFGTALVPGQIVTLIWYQNEIGSIVPWGPTISGDTIYARGNNVWVNSELLVDRTNLISYNPVAAINDEQPTTTAARGTDPTDEIQINLNTVQLFFDSIYPIGSVYENATNPANPRDYMGLGHWRKFAVGRITMGVPPSSAVGYIDGNNTNELTLTSSNIPQGNLSKPVAVLYSEDPGGIGVVNVTGCLPENANSTTNVGFIKSETITYGTTAVPINISPPVIYTYKWVRVA